MGRIAPQPLQPQHKRAPEDKAPEHLAFVRTMPCIACGTSPCEAAHVRLNDPASGKFQALGQKPGDRWTVPLCARHHREAPDAQHVVGERQFWARLRIDPHGLAMALWDAREDREKAERLCREARRRFYASEATA
jgi:hypothetical protein